MSGQAVAALPPDRLNEVGVLRRREIEARILVPVLEALGAEFGRARVWQVAREVIVRIAREQGAQLAAALGGNSLADFARGLEDWKKDDAYQMEVREQSAERFAFDVTRCRYAEMYRALGIPEVGVLLSCNRDFALIEGFNPAVRLTRTQTIMEGASHCDFRFVLTRPAPGEEGAGGAGPGAAGPRVAGTPGESSADTGVGVSPSAASDRRPTGPGGRPEDGASPLAASGSLGVRRPGAEGGDPSGGPGPTPGGTSPARTDPR